MNEDSKSKLRWVVYELLEDLAEQPSMDVYASQNMGVGLPANLKKDSVNIYQIQSLKISITIKKLTQMMRILDQDADEPITVIPEGKR